MYEIIRFIVLSAFLGLMFRIACLGPGIFNNSFLLRFIYFSVNRICFNKVFMRPNRIDLSVVHYNNFVRINNRCDSLGDNDYSGSRKVFFRASRIFASVTVSTALVLSSSIIIFGFFKRALAMQRRCFCPPDTFTPPCPSTVS